MLRWFAEKRRMRRAVNYVRAYPRDESAARAIYIDLTWLFWTKLCEKLSLERSFGYAEEEVQR